MQRRTLIAVVVLNILISAGVIFGILALFGPQTTTTGQTTAGQVITVEVRITSTPAPTYTPWIITTTPLPGTPNRADLPPGVLPETSPGAPQVVPTLDETAAAGNPGLIETNAALPPNCVAHALQSGESPAFLSGVYGVSVESILQANNLTEEDATLLQIGQVLIIPLEGCSFIAPTSSAQQVAAAGDNGGEDTAEDTPEATALPELPTVTPTITLAPTAADSQIVIVNVVGRGDVTAEGVEIRNNGQSVEITGWTISDAQGTVYTFPTRFLFQSSQITLYTRVGTDVAVANFWNRDTAVWGEPGDVVTLANARGEVQATLRLP